MNRKNFISNTVLALLGIPLASKVTSVAVETTTELPVEVKELPQWLLEHMYKRWYLKSNHRITRESDVMDLTYTLDITNIKNSVGKYIMSLPHKEFVLFKEKMSRRMAGEEVDMSEFDKKVRSISA